MVLIITIIIINLTTVHWIINSNIVALKHAYNYWKINKNRKLVNAFNINYAAKKYVKIIVNK